MGKRIAILQSNYIPWKGYFDLINMVDEFVLFDDMQYTRRDWRNRNKIKTTNGLQWLTIPVDVKGKYLQKINETTVSDLDWHDKHWKAIIHSYAKAPYFRQFREPIEELYSNSHQASLSYINYIFLTGIAKILDIKTLITWSTDYEIIDGKTERLVHICKQAGATEYLSGPAAREYIDRELFSKADIDLQFMDYSAYPEYPQLFPPFEHGVSIIDLIFNVGSNYQYYMKSF